MTDTVWGEPIPVDGKRPEWLRDDEKVRVVWGRVTESGPHPAHCVCGWEDSVKAIRLPADHDFYKAQEKGFTYWPGGTEPPEGDIVEVLFRNGDILDAEPALYWDHQYEGDDIIGYRLREPTQDDGEYVRIKRMTKAEWYSAVDEAGGSFWSWAESVGLIRKETDAQRFTRETGIEVTPEIQRALEWRAGR